ncbi:MAG: hypothetical protein QOI81_197 [Actinomycetota bacterium]|nr:hypothetical protein [Actinomycetota bacterium]
MSKGSGFRNAPSEAPARRGLLDSVLGYRPPSDAPIPKLRTAFVRGAVAVCSTPWLIAVPLVALLAVWLGVVLSGFPGPFGLFGGFLSLPPFSTNFDVTLPAILLPAKIALLGGLVSVLPRGVFLALTTGMIVDVLDGKSVSRGSLRSGIRALPTAVGVCILGIGFWLFTFVAAPLLGPGIGTLVQIGLPALGIYLFGYAITIAVSEGKGMADSLSKSVRAARVPGSNTLPLALLYVFVSFAFQIVIASKYQRFDVNPTVGAWVWVLLMNVFHVCIYATLAFRYLAFAHVVADSRPRPARDRSGKTPPLRAGTPGSQGKGASAKRPQSKGSRSKNARNRRR